MDGEPPGFIDQKAGKQLLFETRDIYLSTTPVVVDLKRRPPQAAENKVFAVMGALHSTRSLLSCARSSEAGQTLLDMAGILADRFQRTSDVVAHFC